jgi:aryl-alcohol dehydrogenase-like predicted oxidoreductase
METRQLGNSDLHITVLGFGAWAIGGGNWEASWGPQDDHESIEAIHRALDLGMNWIDTAAVYGLGHSEDVVARALKGTGKHPYIFTKCSLVWDASRKVSNNLKAQSVRREVENSLRRLQVDVIDLYQIHWPDPDADIEEGWRTLADFRAQGKVRWIGLSNFSVSQMRRVMPIAPITSLQPPYSLLHREIDEEILPFCAQHNIGVIVYSPMASGMLTGAMTRERIANMPPDDHRQRRDEFREPQLTRNLELVERLRAIGKRYGRSPGEVAIAWTLRHPAVTGAIVGARNAKQVDGIIGAADFRLSDADAAEIESYMSQLA